MKRKLCLALATVLAFGMVATGCGKNTTTSNTTVSNTTGSNTTAPAASNETAKKIVLFQSKTEIQDSLMECVKAFKDETGIEVEVWETTGDDYQTQLEGKLANKQGPTIFTQQGGASLDRLQDYCANISDMEVLKSISEGLTADITRGDKVMGIPYTMEGFGIVYNKDLCDATAFKNAEDFIAKIQEMNAKGIEGFELTQENYFLIAHILNTPFALMDDSDAFIANLASGDQNMADQPIFKEFAELMVAIRENCSNPLEQNYDGQIGDLCTGKAAMIHQGNWCAGMFGDYNFSNAGLAPLPIGGNDKISVSVPYYWAINSSATPAEQEAAKVFLNWLYTSQTGKDYLYNKFSFVPVVNGDTNNNLDVLSQDMQKYASENKVIGWNMAKWPSNAIDVYFAPLAQEFFISEMTAEEFLKALDDAYDQAVANQG